MPSFITYHSSLVVQVVRRHMVSVTMHFSAQVPAANSRHCKLVSKRSKLVRFEEIEIEGSTRVKFIQSFLSVHQLADKYSPGILSGPAFRLFWTGSVYVCLLLYTQIN